MPTGKTGKKGQVHVRTPSEGPVNRCNSIYLTNDVPCSQKATRSNVFIKYQCF